MTPSRGEVLPFDFPKSRLPQAKPGAALELGLESECHRQRGSPAQSNRLELWSARFGAGPRTERRFMGD